ncbi:GntR family transcriptional regulator [Rhodobacteraceae bacterium D3-12]|nr:GntR family transcriptional regulator [Rhodobacteraceae bacterium D3-12]
MQPVDRPKSLMEVTSEKIRDAIVAGELPLGSKLSEQRLADTLGVSRSPVRDALAVLQSEGLVAILPKRGTFVFTPDLRVVDELCEHRAILETAALRLGIERNHADVLRQLEKASTEMERALKSNDAYRYTMGDHQFHNAIVEGARNRTLTKTYNQTVSPLKALRTHLFTIMSENSDRSMAEHFALIEAVAARQTEQAVSQLAVHIGHLEEAFRAKLLAERAEKVERAVS